MSCLSLKAHPNPSQLLEIRTRSQWVSSLSGTVDVSFLSETVSSLVSLLHASGFAFALGHAYLQLAVRPHMGSELKECPEPVRGFLVVISSRASRPSSGSYTGAGV